MEYPTVGQHERGAGDMNEQSDEQQRPPMPAEAELSSSAAAEEDGHAYVQGEEVDGHIESTTPSPRSLLRSRPLRLAAGGGILLPASGVAFLWLRRRRTARPNTA